MTGKWLERTLQLMCVACLAAQGAVATAQDVVPPSSDTFELSIGAGFGHGVGPVGARVPTLQSEGKSGGTILVDAGWRIDPRWMVGAYGEGSLFQSGNLATSSNAKSVAAGLQAQFHIIPGGRYDPWVGVGFGWRGYWADREDGTHILQGLDLGRLRLGLDYRMTSTLAMGPVFGITLTEFLSERRAGGQGYFDVRDRKLNTFVFGGLAGRFNL